MYTSTFSKHWDNIHGFTREEAEQKRDAVNKAHGVNQPNSKWNPAEIVSDHSRKDGFMVVINTKV